MPHKNIPIKLRPMSADDIFMHPNVMVLQKPLPHRSDYRVMKDKIFFAFEGNKYFYVVGEENIEEILRFILDYCKKKEISFKDASLKKKANKALKNMPIGY